MALAVRRRWADQYHNALKQLKQKPPLYERDPIEDDLLAGNLGAHWNLSVPALYEQAVARGEGLASQNGALLVDTGQYTGRSANDKFTVREAESAASIWWNPGNRPLEPARFDALYERVREHLRGRDLFVQDCYAGADPTFRIPIRIISEKAWQALFASHLFLRADSAQRLQSSRVTVIAAPDFRAEPSRDGTNSEVFIALNLTRRLILIGGTAYAGEIKKSIFTALNYWLPIQGLLSMHCAANLGARGDVALFFGLSGTGKTTLSTDPERRMIGDDEHAWSDDGVFNLEGGCYAKVIRLSEQDEPQIYAAVHRFTAVLENVIVDPNTRAIDLDDASRTENTRAAYPLTFIPNAVPEEMAGHPSNIFLLTADAFGILPPVARLTTEQAMYYFLAGYTAKVAGTERGGPARPEATFSPCFAAPFLPLPPTTYARLLGAKLARHDVQCWLVNTGWLGGQPGVGQRIPISYTRAIIREALNGSLREVPYESDPIFGLSIPATCPGVPLSILQPRTSWSDGAAYDELAVKLRGQFDEHYELWRRTNGKA